MHYICRQYTWCILRNAETIQSISGYFLWTITLSNFVHDIGIHAYIWVPYLVMKSTCYTHHNCCIIILAKYQKLVNTVTSVHALSNDELQLQLKYYINNLSCCVTGTSAEKKNYPANMWCVLQNRPITYNQWKLIHSDYMMQYSFMLFSLIRHITTMASRFTFYSKRDISLSLSNISQCLGDLSQS